MKNIVKFFGIAALVGSTAVASFYAGKNSQEADILVRGGDYTIRLMLEDKSLINHYGGLEDVERLLRFRGLETMGDLRAPKFKEVFTNITKRAIKEKYTIIENHMNSTTIHPLEFYSSRDFSERKKI